MDIFQLLAIVLLLLIAAEVSYLVVKLPRQNSIKKQARTVFVDTSVLIDGRILSVAKTGFIGDKLVIPRSVIGELQYLADNADHEKRARARHGLDVVTELQAIPEADVTIMQDGSKAPEGVDERLLSLAKKHGGVVCTIDYNLNKVAVVEGITVLNINELAQSLRMAHLPGETMMLELVQKGQDEHQAVGYLPDGTMVVVEQSNRYIGKTVEVAITRSLQTAAGKMMFARRVEKHDKPAVVRKPSGKKPVAPVSVKPKEVVKKDEPVTAYHSDAKEQQRATSGNRTKPAQKQTKQSFSANRQKPAKRKDHESSLIDLVENQK